MVNGDIFTNKQITLFTIAKKFDGREAPNSISLCKALMFSTIELANSKLVTNLFTNFFPSWGKLLTMATPRGIKLDEHWPPTLNQFVHV